LMVSMARRASGPEDASPTSLKSWEDASMARAAARGTTLSSTTSTRYLL
jgi:hypothetical protein